MNLWRKLKSIFSTEKFYMPGEITDMPGQPKLPAVNFDGIAVYYTPHPNYFGTVETFENTSTKTKSYSMNWHFCRDLFHSGIDNDKDDKFYFYSLGHQGPKETVELVNWVEDKLKLGNRTALSIFYGYKRGKTGEKQNILKVQPSPFWRGKLKHSFLSALLRASTENPDSKPEKMIEKCKYFADLSYVNRFLEGNTKFVGEYVGFSWMNTMEVCRNSNLTPEKTWEKP